MEQGTKDWLKWRRSGIGSSDAPAVLNKSPYHTPYSLWRDKLGLREDNELSEIMHLGQVFETPARARASVETGVDFEPAVVEHETYRFLRASLDGFGNDKDRVVFAEIKLVGREKMEKARAGEIVEHHRIQMDHQFLVTGVKKAFYVCYTLTPDKKKMDQFHMMPIEPRLDFIEKELLPKELEFWDLVLRETPPELSDKDELRVDDLHFNQVAYAYRALLSEMKEKESELERLKKQLTGLTEKSSIVACGGLRIQKIFRRGNVDYSKIEVLKGIDLDQFRKNGSEYVQIKEICEKS